MNILLIGGTGFIGKALAGYFLADATCYVASVGRSEVNSDTDRFRNYNIALTGWNEIVAELNNRRSWVVIDLAYSSVPNTSFQDPVTDFSENLGLINKHLSAIRALDVHKYLYISSGGTVYGKSAQERNGEDDANFPRSPYGITKMASERYVYMHHIHHDLNVNIIRPSNVYGPGQLPYRGQGFVATALAMTLEHKKVPVFGDGSMIRDYIYISDFCAALSDAVRLGKPGEIYNIGSGEGCSLAALIAIMSGIVQEEGYEIMIEHLPERKFDVPRNILNNDKLVALNGWQPVVSLQQGIKLTWNWIKKQKLN